MNSGILASFAAVSILLLAMSLGTEIAIRMYGLYGRTERWFRTVQRSGLLIAGIVIAIGLLLAATR